MKLEPRTPEPLSYELRLLEAQLFAATSPLTEIDLIVRMPPGADVKARLAELAALYQGRGVELVQLAGGWAFRTAPDLATALRVTLDVSRKLSRAAVEALAIIAYHQPVTRGEIEEIRGVQLSRGTLDILLESGWIKPKGRRRTPGRPVTWVTTPGFLDHFGLTSLDDLPGVEELKAAGLLDKRSGITIAMREEEAEAALQADVDDPVETLLGDDLPDLADERQSR
ncbi:MAG: SMC-Scp complex subunit ScpB [Elstera sp.]|jgi:segregation and condensation protein B|uniref:SMC-Scp complex subunit ScpB n=1 Tax=Elstera sp. TaxID=1916664 RepID=UPI0037C0923B